MQASPIELRPIADDDTDNIVKWRNRVRKHFIYQKKINRQDHQKWLANHIRTKRSFQYIITNKLNHQDIGSVYLRDVDNVNKKAEMGIFIGEMNYQGKGLGSAAIQEILSIAFNQLKLNKVYLRVFSDNTNAIKSYSRSGFLNEGCFVQDVIINRKKRDVVFMAVIKEHWKHK